MDYYCMNCRRIHKKMRAGKISKIWLDHKEYGVTETPEEMILAERIRLKPTVQLKEICTWARKITNMSNWYRLMDFEYLENVLSDSDVRYILTGHDLFRFIPHSADLLIRRNGKSWKSYFMALKEYKKDRTKFNSIPKPPGFKRDESVMEFDYIQCKIKDGFLHFPEKAGLEPVKVESTMLKTVRIVPRGNRYWLEVTKPVFKEDKKLSKERVIGIDYGVNNFVTITPSFNHFPIIVKGGIVKSINQYYNKQRARYSSITKKTNDLHSTKRLKYITEKRNEKISNFIHHVSRMIIEWCIENNVGAIAIGENKGWKQEIKIGKTNTQNFVGIPFYKMTTSIKYKAELVGIEVKTINEMYSSKASFIDRDELPTRLRDKKKGEKYDFSGRRISRGMYKSKEGILINADINGAGNIMRKAFPEVEITNGIEALVRPAVWSLRRF